MKKYIKMNIVNPSVKLLDEEDYIKHVAKCARVCYDSKGVNDAKLYNALINSGHHSMFRHETHYYMIPSNADDKAYSIATKYKQLLAKNNHICGIDVEVSKLCLYVAINGNWMLSHVNECIAFQPYKVTTKEFANTEVGYNMMRYTFEVITQISTSRELNRVSPNNIAERSTRYVYENGSIVKPWWLSEYQEYKYNSDIYNNTIVQNYLQSCQNSFEIYKLLVDNGMKKEDARGVLPLDTMTKCIYTYSIKEWREIINLRYYGTTGKPHPNAKIIAGMIKHELEELGYNFE